MSNRIDIGDVLTAFWNAFPDYKYSPTIEIIPVMDSEGNPLCSMVSFTLEDGSTYLRIWKKPLLLTAGEPSD